MLCTNAFVNIVYLLLSACSLFFLVTYIQWVEVVDEVKLPSENIPSIYELFGGGYTNN